MLSSVDWKSRDQLPAVTMGKGTVEPLGEAKKGD